MASGLNTLQIYQRLKKAVAKEIADILGDLVDERLVTKEDLARLRADLILEIERSRSATVMWVAGMLIAQAAIVATLVKLL